VTIDSASNTTAMHFVGDDTEAFPHTTITGTYHRD
jgi:hypothetical protein